MKATLNLLGAMTQSLFLSNLKLFLGKSFPQTLSADICIFLNVTQLIPHLQGVLAQLRKNPFQLLNSVI